MDNRMAKKIILITGASSGLGKATALKLLEKGHIVYATSSDVKNMGGLKRIGGYVHKLDVRKDKDVKKVVKLIIKEHGRIDVLINNAGYGQYGTIESAPIKDIQKQYDVNVFGMARMLQYVLPHMRKRKEGLVVNIASAASYVSPPGMGWYSSTKHAVKGMSDALRLEVKNLGVKVVLIKPGAIKTKFDKVAFKAMNKTKHPKDYQKFLICFKRSVIKMYNKCPRPERSAVKIAKVVEVENPKPEYRTTVDSKIWVWMEKNLPKRWVDLIILRKLKLR